MLSPNWDMFRLFLHVLAASVWVGGQVTLAGVVPVLRRRQLDMAVRLAARGFARVAWPAFGVLVLTGMWNLVEVDITDTTSAYQQTLLLKILLAAASGAAAAVHAVGRSKLALAIGGAVGLLAALGAMFCGYLLTAGS
jgi:putative copper export protein